MRKIKFRAWDWHEKIIKEVGILQNPMNGSRQTVFDKNGDEIQFCYLMQYTGVKDKQRKEIYEGNIIKLLGHKPNNDIDIEEVIFLDGKFCHTYQNRPPKKFWKYAEIIGNIYENPELLNNK